MNATPDELTRLIHVCLDGRATAEEAARLNALLRTDTAARDLYLQFADTHSCLSVDEQLWNADAAPVSAPLPRFTWLSWPQFTAAAAGIVFGMLCTSIVFAYVAPSLGKVVSLLDESFESPGMAWPQGFPAKAGTWGGERGRIVGTLSEIVPMEGEGMAELAPADDANLSYLDRIIDLRGYPKPEAHEVRQIEVTASFHAASPGFKERYTLRVATFGEGPAEIQSKWVNVPWRDMDGITLTMSKRGLSAPADASGWQTLSVMVEAPADASSIVISLAAGRLETSAPKTPHYLDNIHARLLISPRTTHPRNRRR